MHIGHVAVRTTDLSQAAGHLKQTLGLTETSADERQVLLSSNEKHHELQVIAGTTAGFDHVGFELESEEDLEEAVARAIAAGAEQIAGDDFEPGLGSAVRLLGPGGIVYELYVSMERKPLDAAGYIAEQRVRRFGHLTFTCADHEAVLAFWLDGLGFRISDEADGLTWARCDANHHSLAVGPRPPGTGNFLHHHAWEVRDFAQLGKNCDLLAAERIRLLWGPVRHGPGFNFASYLADLDGGVIEMFSDLLRIYDEENYTPADWSDEPAALNLWGPPPAPEFFQAGLPVLAPAA
jgi:catechol-2,3-dioxygenase